MTMIEKLQQIEDAPMQRVGAHTLKFGGRSWMYGIQLQSLFRTSQTQLTLVPQDLVVYDLRSTGRLRATAAMHERVAEFLMVERLAELQAAYLAVVVSRDVTGLGLSQATLLKLMQRGSEHVLGPASTLWYRGQADGRTCPLLVAQVMCWHAQGMRRDLEIVPVPRASPGGGGLLTKIEIRRDSLAHREQVHATYGFVMQFPPAPVAGAASSCGEVKQSMEVTTNPKRVMISAEVDECAVELTLEDVRAAVVRLLQEKLAASQPHLCKFDSLKLEPRWAGDESDIAAGEGAFDGLRVQWLPGVTWDASEASDPEGE